MISKQKTALLFRLSVSLTVFGALFSFMSVPLILTGVIGMVIFHSLQFFQKKKKLPIDYSRHTLIVAFSFTYIFSIFSLNYSTELALLTKATLVVFILLFCKEIIETLLKSVQNNLLLHRIGTEKLSHIIGDLATVYILIASLFKILDWKFGIVNAQFLLVIGLFTSVISILASALNFEK